MCVESWYLFLDYFNNGEDFSEVLLLNSRNSPNKNLPTLPPAE